MRRAVRNNSVGSAAVCSILAEYEDLGEGSYSAASAVRCDELSRIF